MFFVLLRVLTTLIIITVLVLVFRRLTRKEVLTGDMEDKRVDKDIVDDYKHEHKPKRRHR